VGIEKDDLKHLLTAARKVGLDPSKLQAANPYTFEGPKAMALQHALATIAPEVAERLQADAGVKVSLGLQAALDGFTDFTPELEMELETKLPATYGQMKAEALEAAYKASAMHQWEVQREEAAKVAEDHGYDVRQLQLKGEHMAAQIAAEHRDRERAAADREQREFIRSVQR